MVKTRPTSILTARFTLLFASNLIVVSAYFLLMTMMAYYAVSAFGVDSAIAGLAASIFLLGGVVGRIASGRFGFQVGLKRIAFMAMAVQLAMCVLYYCDFFGITFLLVIRLVHGISFGILNTVLPAMAMDALPPDRMGEGTGYYMLSNSLGAGLGPLMSALIAIGIDYAVLFSCCSALSIAAAAMVIPVRPHTEPVSTPDVSIENAEPRKPGSALERTLDMSAFKFCVFMFLVAFSYSSVTAFVNSYAIEQGMGVFAPFVFLVYSVVLVIIRPITGKLMDRRGENVILYPWICNS